MVRYGGFFVNYMNKDVTHIICANLPDSKIKLTERVKERSEHTCSVYPSLESHSMQCACSCHRRGLQSLHRACAMPHLLLVFLT